jgi:hypothetical protein
MPLPGAESLHDTFQFHLKHPFQGIVAEVAGEMHFPSDRLLERVVDTLRM